MGDAVSGVATALAQLLRSLLQAPPPPCLAYSVSDWISWAEQACSEEIPQAQPVAPAKVNDAALVGRESAGTIAPIDR